MSLFFFAVATIYSAYRKSLTFYFFLDCLAAPASKLSWLTPGTVPAGILKDGLSFQKWFVERANDFVFLGSPLQRVGF